STDNIIDSNLTADIVECLRPFLESEELSDIIITVNGTEFKCHKLILASQSKYFRNYFKTTKTESTEPHILDEISSNVFKLILQVIYTGCKIVNKDNVFDIMKAANYLQISYLENECARSIKSFLSLENCVDFYVNGTEIDSEKAKKIVWPFILENFNLLWKTQQFPNLPKNDLLKLVESKDLMSGSEDCVVEAIMFWASNRSVKNAENDLRPINQTDESSELQTSLNEPAFKKRKLQSELNEGILVNEKCLVELFTHVKLPLVSQKCLETLINHSDVQGYCKLSHLIIKALSYHAFIDKREVYWPADATHRKHSEYRNSILLATKIKKNISIKEYLFASKSWTEFPKPQKTKVFLKLAVSGTSLYAFSRKHPVMEDSHGGKKTKKRSIEISQYIDSDWLTITSLSLPNINFSVVTVGKFLYILCPVGKKVWKLDSLTRRTERMKDLLTKKPIRYAIHYSDLIVVFYSVQVPETPMTNTNIACYDIQKNNWSFNNGSNQHFEANGMTSFRDELNTYIILSSGDMWKIVQSTVGVDFDHVEKLWKIDWRLHGAVVVMKELYIFGMNSSEHKSSQDLKKSVLGFHKINYIYRNNCTENSTFVPFIRKK
ncbi:kelch protein 5, partial [Biomphalaria glabrata]